MDVKQGRADRRHSWPVRVHRLGEEPCDDLSAATTPEARLAMMWELAVEAFVLSGAPLPDYERHETPVTRRAVPPRPGA